MISCFNCVLQVTFGFFCTDTTLTCSSELFDPIQKLYAFFFCLLFQFYTLVFYYSCNGKGNPFRMSLLAKAATLTVTLIIVVCP